MMRSGGSVALGVLVLGGLVLGAGCAMVGAPYDGPGGEGGGLERGGSADGSATGSSAMGGGGSEPVAAGTLTAGAWDDNRNFERFTDFLAGHPGERLNLSDAEHEAARLRHGDARAVHARLDIALVVDTTGSMSDEIHYLQAELDSIAETVEGTYPEAETRWSLIVYRDTTDEYVTRVFGFRSADALRADLAAQSAGGGGDYPEASHTALTDLTNLAWRDAADVARVAFWVADAPHHDAATGALTEAIRTAAELDLHLYPVASSGVDLRTEVSMRSAAQITGGRYLFLTDDSGVGGEHLEPSVPCYFVTLLSHAMERMITIEMTGVYVEPEAGEVIRTGGDPTDGACTLADGTVARVF